MKLETLNRLRRKGEFYREIAPDWCRNLWRRPEAFENFCKQHRAPLKSEGVLVRIGRDYFVDAERFPMAAARLLGVDGGEK